MGKGPEAAKQGATRWGGPSSYNPPRRKVQLSGQPQRPREFMCLIRHLDPDLPQSSGRPNPGCHIHSPRRPEAVEQNDHPTLSFRQRGIGFSQLRGFSLAMGKQSQLLHRGGFAGIAGRSRRSSQQTSPARPRQADARPSERAVRPRSHPNALTRRIATIGKSFLRPGHLLGSANDGGSQDAS